MTDSTNDPRSEKCEATSSSFLPSILSQDSKPTAFQLSILAVGEREGDGVHPDDAALLRDWASGKSPHSRRLYRRITLLLFKRYPGKRLHEFHKHELEQFLSERERSLASPDSLKTEAQVIKSLFSYAAKDGFIPRSPALLIRRNGTPPEVRIQKRSMSQSETLHLIAFASCPRDQVLFKFLYATALRVSEIAGRQWKHLQPYGNGEAKLLILGKGGRPALIKIPSTIYTELLTLHRPETLPSDPLFAHHLDPQRPMTAGGIWERVKVAIAHGSIFKPVSPHWFRHANASHSLAAGCPLPVVRDTLRHASIATTSSYVHAQEGCSSSDYLELGRDSAGPIDPKRGLRS